MLSFSELSGRRLARAIADSMPTSAQREINPRQLCVMLALIEGPLVIHELRTLLGLSVATASQWVHETEAKGLVDVNQDQADKRRRIAQLTAKGRAWMRDCRANKKATDEDQHVDERDARQADGPSDLDSF